MVPRTWTCTVCQAVVSGSSLCGGCRKVAYCGKEHQAVDRAAHKPHCFFPFVQKGGIETNRVLLFDISIQAEVQPLIWRTIQVPKNYSFGQFHKAIQIAFGWNSVQGANKAHHFMVLKRDQFIGIKDYNYEDGTTTALDEDNKFLKDYLEALTGPICAYAYDIQNSLGWLHMIEFRGEIPAERDVVYPRCLAGQQAGIPEDIVDKIPGYYRICKIIKNPEHKEYKKTIEWLESQGKPNYNPDTFDPSQIIFA